MGNVGQSGWDISPPPHSPCREHFGLGAGRAERCEQYGVCIPSTSSRYEAVLEISRADFYPGGAVTETIAQIYAPLISKLCRTFPIRVGHLFDGRTLQAFGRASDICLEDWESSDPFFDSLKTKLGFFSLSDTCFLNPVSTFKLPARDMTVWKLEDADSCAEDDTATISLGNVTDSILHLTSKTSPLSATPTATSLGPSAAESPDLATPEHWTWTDVLDAIAQATGPDHIKIKTALNLAHPKNSFTLRGASRQKTLEFTRERRALAGLAHEPRHFEEFQKMVSDLIARSPFKSLSFVF